MTRKRTSSDSAPQAQQAKRSYTKQSDWPKRTLEDAMRIAQAIADQYACQPTKPLLVAQAVGMSPTSSTFRQLSAASSGYGLTHGTAWAKQIGLRPLGQELVGSTDEAGRLSATRQAATAPRLFGAFLKKYNNSKVPRREIACKVLQELGCPEARAKQCFDILMANAKECGLITQVKGADYFNLEAAPSTAVGTTEPAEVEEAEGEIAEAEGQGTLPAGLRDKPSARSNRVFIGHGGNRQIVDQLKQILTFGKFIPVVAEEHETTSKPVPDKVFDDMRGCFAGIIHVAGEEKLLTANGEERHLLNENVLIEIGGALALYGRNVILLCQKGVALPSNLQGLYRCNYEGEKLDYDATMKLLKAFNDFDRRALA
jgi:predicted nucleotide-binding protein